MGNEEQTKISASI